MSTTRYGKPSSPTSSSSIASRRSCSARDSSGVDQDEHLDLVELVHAEHAARVLAGGAGLAAEVGRVAGVAQRQLVEDLAHVQRGERHLRRAGQVEAVALVEAVQVRLLGGQEAGAVHGLLADEHGRQDELEAARGQPVDREAVERELEQRGVAAAVGEARAGEPRAALHVDPVVGRAELEVVARREVEAGRGADLAQHDGVLVGQAVGRLGIGRFGMTASSCSRSSAASACSASRRVSSSLRAFSSSLLLRRRLALELRRAAQLVDPPLRRAPARVGLEQAVEVLGGAAARERRRGSPPDRCGRRECRSRRHRRAGHASARRSCPRPCSFRRRGAGLRAALLARDGRDVRGHVLDLLGAELVLERRHHAHPVRHARRRRARAAASPRRGWGRPAPTRSRRPACGTPRSPGLMNTALPAAASPLPPPPPRGRGRRRTVPSTVFG